MQAITLYFGVVIDEGLLLGVAMVFVVGTLVVWVRSYIRSRCLGWLCMAIGVALPAQGMFIDKSYVWAAAGAMLVFGGALSVLAAMRDDRREKGDGRAG